MKSVLSTINGLEFSFSAAVDGKGSITIIQGGSGAGKTHTVSNFVKKKESASIILKCKGRPHDRTAMYPIYEALVEHRSPLSWRAKIERIFRGIIDSFGAAAHFVEPILDEVEYYRGTKGPPIADYLPTNINPNCFRLLTSLSKKSTTILWIDDFQWVDCETLKFMAYLRDRICSIGLMVVLCINDAKIPHTEIEIIEDIIGYLKQPGEHSNVATHVLEAATLDELPSLLSDICGKQVVFGPKDLKIIYSKSNGVPYIVKTYLDVLRDIGLIYEQNGRVHLREHIRDLSIPSTIRDAIDIRLRQIYRRTPEARKLLETASVIGEIFSTETIGAVLRLCKIYNLLNVLESEHYIIRQLLQGRCWAFDHILTRDYIYESLGPVARELHKSVADHLCKIGGTGHSEIAHHYKCAGEIRNYVQFILKHASQSLRQGYFLEARRAFEELEAVGELFTYIKSPDTRFEFCYEKALLEYFTGHYNLCLEHSSKLLKSAKSIDQITKTNILRAKCLNKSSKMDDFLSAANILEKLVMSSKKTRTARLAGHVYNELCVSYAHLNRFRDGARVFKRAEQIISPIDTPIEFAQLMRKSCAFLEPEISIPVLEGALKIFDEHNIIHEQIKCLTNISAMYYLLKRYTPAQRQIERGLEKCIELDNYGSDYLLNNWGIIEFSKNNIDCAEKLFRKALKAASRDVCRLIIQNNLAVTLFINGNVDDAQDIVSSTLITAEQTGETSYILPLKYNRLMICISKYRRNLAVKQLFDYSRAVHKHYDAEEKQWLEKVESRISAMSTEPSNKLANTDHRDTRPHLSELRLIEMQFWGD